MKDVKGSFMHNGYEVVYDEKRDDYTIIKPINGKDDFPMGEIVDKAKSVEEAKRIIFFDEQL